MKVTLVGPTYQFWAIETRNLITRPVRRRGTAAMFPQHCEEVSFATGIALTWNGDKVVSPRTVIVRRSTQEACTADWSDEEFNAPYAQLVKPEPAGFRRDAKLPRTKPSLIRRTD